LDNNVALSAESVFVRMENSEMQRLISVRMDRNQALNLAIFPKFSCKFPSIRMEIKCNNSHSLFSVHTDGKQQNITKFPSVRTENSE